MNNNEIPKTQYPLITVITAVYNAAGFIEETIKSVIEHEYPNLHYIIIDGGSTDGTVDVIRNYQSRISVWLSEKDEGIYDAMNKGWALAEDNSFIMFLGAGDRLISLPQEMQFFRCHEVVYGDVYLGPTTLFKGSAGVRLKIYNSLHHQALLIHKSLHKARPFDLSYPIYADFDFNQRLMVAGAKFVRGNGFLSFALPGGASDKKAFSESLLIIRKNQGGLWTLTALVCFILIRVIPPLKILRPFSRISSSV